MIAILSLFFSYDKAKQIFYYSLLGIYTVCSESVPSSQHGCMVICGVFMSVEFLCYSYFFYLP